MGFFKRTAEYSEKKKQEYIDQTKRILGDDEDLNKSLKEAAKPVLSPIPIKLGLSLVTYPFKAPFRVVRMAKRMIDYGSAKADRAVSFEEVYINKLGHDEDYLQQNYSLRAMSTCTWFFVLLIQIGFVIYYITKLLSSNSGIDLTQISVIGSMPPLMLIVFCLFYQNGVRTYQIKNRDMMQPGFFNRLVFMKTIDGCLPSPKLDIRSKEKEKEFKRNRLKRSERRSLEKENKKQLAKQVRKNNKN
ncbi:hypothetical protein D5B42_23270 [Salmonella enterica subsp. enterica serovar Oranienburg]|nr:hypothetical protein [Salmonella enterica subsp. enterica serovar Oranienburg]